MAKKLRFYFTIGFNKQQAYSNSNSNKMTEMNDFKVIENFSYLEELILLATKNGFKLKYLTYSDTKSISNCTIQFYKPSHKKSKYADFFFCFDEVDITVGSTHFPFFKTKKICKVSHVIIKNELEIKNLLGFKNKREDCDYSFDIKEDNGKKIATEGFGTKFFPYASELISKTLMLDDVRKFHEIEEKIVQMNIERLDVYLPFLITPTGHETQTMERLADKFLTERGEIRHVNFAISA